jgi:hypothetical protein
MYLKNITFATLLLLAFSFCFWGCSGKSEEDLIRETIEEIGDYAEDRDKYGIISYISDSYSDDKERTKEDIETLLEDNFDKYQGIVVNILGTEFIDVNPPKANVEIDTAFSSGAAKMFRKLVRFSGHCYRFKVELIKEDDQWKVKSASWKFISEDELSTESMEILKELFPKL